MREYQNRSKNRLHNQNRLTGALAHKNVKAGYDRQFLKTLTNPIFMIFYESNKSNIIKIGPDVLEL